MPLRDLRQKLLATFQIEHREHVEQIRALAALLEKTGGQPGAELEEAFRRAHSLKGAARAVDLRSIEDLAHRLETLFSRVRQGVLLFDKDVAGVVQHVLDASDDTMAAFGENRPAPSVAPALQAIGHVLAIETEEASPAAAEQPPAFQPLDTMRITAQNFDGLLRSAAGVLAESYRQKQVTEQLAAMARQIERMGKDAQKEGELLSLSRQAAAVRRLHERSSWTMHHLGRQLQRDVWQARMSPAESLLDGFRKMMRDLARDESKEIEFRATGAGVHADRRVLERIKDPLMHLLRNAVSHGIEPRAERVAKGKSPVGLVTLRIDAEGPRLTITVEDDGRGVDFARVAEVAAREGIEAAHLSPNELARVLFRPGFSTSRSVTSLSGRGMGLSVVQEAIRRLEGEVELRPAESGGTCVHLSVPLSISTHRLLLVRSSGQTFAIPLHSVERLYRVKVSTIETLEGKPVVTLNGQATPLLSLQALLTLEQPAAASDVLRIMMVRSRNQRAAVAVDTFLWESDAVIQDLGPAAKSDGKVTGGILLEDGSVAFVLNPAELLETHAHWALPDSSKKEEQAAPTILVVDDSMTTRTLEKSILEAHGYRVRVAFDGMEALGQLRAERADLVVTDVQMPRMDGFELLDAMKKDSNLNRIPVIVVTSLERREDQERGLALGADAYIVKRKFDQAELLGAIRQIL